MFNQLRNVICILILLIWFWPRQIFSQVQEMKYRGLNAIQMESTNFQITILPDRGANITALIDRRTGRQWLWQNPEAYKLPVYGAEYIDYDISGFDDFFPTVGKCLYPEEPWLGITIPDHGEVWAIPWEYKLGKKQAVFAVYGVKLPYRLAKRIVLFAGGVKIQYSLFNNAHLPLKVISAAHPLISISPDMQIFLPKGTVIKGDIAPWQLEERNNVAIIQIGPQESSKEILYRETPTGLLWLLRYHHTRIYFLYFSS